jgi:hypothetical protein
LPSKSDKSKHAQPQRFSYQSRSSSCSAAQNHECSIELNATVSNGQNVYLTSGGIFRLLLPIVSSSAIEKWSKAKKIDHPLLYAHFHIDTFV